MDIFFHVYLKSGYSRILIDKFKKFKSSGLYEKANKIYLTLFGDIELNSEFRVELINAVFICHDCSATLRIRTALRSA